ncbi:cytochrome P450 [Rhodococcus sp. BP-149]|uniref:cytochrome P450 n=1 Tax=unclassified Rhodococcus (in: high G+C Gram-positive bacteria) TaxID=192944 RepID=UPI001C9AFA0C|nr:MULTISPECIES: cytochrome P450 [unclassified Rhodococcus (in: high G+C Gram-positive bacteria)]MBY6685612.1 cytochrome P450 [Rhodococcus sp. BP-288]MBY6694840.1 cytochrome P450 [Rhodococcus sp. BP-188]MBY6696686.1 cytochrome P450 [Rhodococcus sp. BP-285]MBY6703342.1 cytochrome P450 [Rhodococcus sp. BP-283]MBY6710704.1 cytochrome P450 [Rhodococcus sp. BP-160]
MSTFHAFDPFAPDSPAHTGGATDSGAVVHGDYGYAVLDFATATEVLRDSRFVNAALTLMEQFGITDGPVHDFRANSLIMADGPRHMRLRTPLARFMGPSTVEDIRSVLRDIIAEIDPATGAPGPIDFHAAVDQKIPARVYCHLAGAPAADAPRVASLSARTLALLQRDPSLTSSILEAYDELFDYLRELIARKRRDGLGDDMLSFLIRQEDLGKLTSEELLSEATAMLEASSVNTAHQTGLVVWTLLRDRAAWARLIADRSLIPAAVVEACRLYPRPGIVSKIASVDIDLAGTTIPAGSDVHVAVWSANRDPERFADPNTLDLDREASPPLTFSTGLHGCLGQSLAKVEMEEVVRYLIEHHPDAVVVDEGTEIGHGGGRWLVGSLAVDLDPVTAS